MKEGYIYCPRGPWPSLRSNPAPHMAKTVCMPGRCSSVLAPHQVWITNHVYTYKSIKIRNKAELLKMQFSAAPAGTQFLALPVAHSPFCWDLSSVVSDGGCVPAYCMTVVQMELAFSGDVLRTSPRACAPLQQGRSCFSPGHHCEIVQGRENGEVIPSWHRSCQEAPVASRD